MNTFVPYPDVVQSAAALDDLRLNNQISEADVLLSGGWLNHPASKMWAGYHDALAEYRNACLAEWVSRGKKSSRAPKAHSPEPVYPPWWGGAIHASHRSALLRKAFSHYSRFGWTDSPWEPYIWPV